MFETETLLNSNTIWGILVRFAINLAFLIILIGIIYFRYSKKEKFLFTFFLIGIMVFVVASIMKLIDIRIGLAFGLFAIFGILRFRTRNFGVKDMAYIFTAIGLSIVNALGPLVLPLFGVIIIDFTIIVSTLLLELFLQNNLFKKHKITYGNLGMLKPEKRDELLKEISEVTGRVIIKVKILKIDLKKEIAELDIFFKE
jgi:hypothetical protein